MLEECLFVLTYGLVLCLGDEVPFQYCGGNWMEVTSLKIDGCGSGKCSFYTYQTRNFSVTWKSKNYKIERLEMKAEVVIPQQFTYVLNLTPTDPCETMYFCPVEQFATRMYTGQVTMTNLYELPGKKLLRWSAKSKDSSELLACIETSVSTMLYPPL